MKLRASFLLFLCSAAWAQDNTLQRARELAIAGQRAEALQMLERRIASAPEDFDALTLYGIVLSWDQQFDRARRVLLWTLLHQPANDDARQALTRVEEWSRPVRPEGTSEVVAGATYDDFEDSDAWREGELTVKKNFAFGAALVRAVHGSRFGLDDDQIELELYPKFGTKSYAFLNVGYSPHARLYPRSRFGAEFFQGFGSGFEGSIGYRRLNFPEAANLYTASLSKYSGDWLFTVRGYHSEEANSLQGMARRYLGSAENYVGLRLGNGSTRDEIRSVTDVEVLDSFEVAGEARFVVRGPWFLQLRAGAGRPRHVVGSAMLGRRF